MPDQSDEPCMALSSVVYRLGQKATAYQAINHSGFISWLRNCDPSTCSLAEWWEYIRFVKDWRNLADRDVTAVMDYYLKLGIGIMAVAVEALDLEKLRTDFLEYYESRIGQKDARYQYQKLNVAQWFLSVFNRTDLRERLTFLNERYFLGADTMSIYLPQAVALIDKVLIPLLAKLLCIQPDCQPFSEMASGHDWMGRVFWAAAGCNDQNVDQIVFYKSTSLATARQLAATL